MVRVRVPATTANMGPGFDCIGMALELSSQVEIEVVGAGLSIEVEGYGAGQLPLNEDNLVFKVASKLWQQVGFYPAGVRIKLINNIPMAGGLGSSAAAIVGSLVAANYLAGNPLNEGELLNLATAIEGHPDNVAPALLGGIVVAVREQGQVQPLQIEPPANLACIVASPEFELATKASRGVLPKQTSYADAIYNLGRVGLLVGALQQGNLDLLQVALQDRLHQPYRCPLIPGMEKVFKTVMQAGAKGVALSGAGPTVIAFIDTKLGQSHANDVEQAMQAAFAEAGVSVVTRSLRTGRAGACIEITKDVEVGL